MTVERRGTSFRENRIVRGTCARCGEEDALLYDHETDPTLMCADCSRRRAKANPRKETCDECGREGAYRDPITRRNEFFCIECHAKHGTVFQNRWSQAPRISVPLGIHDKAVCEAADYGTECWGEIKWRGEYDKLLCNKHAGKQSSGPEWHQKRQ